jgi:catechol 2,3-dioxygenase-like lactoylglutathione lyase family enzyme
MTKLAFAALLLGPVMYGQEHPRPKLLGVEHISLWAHDVGKSRAYYHDFLGFEEPYTLKNADGSPSVIFFKVNDRQYIQITPEREANTDRLNHYGLQTDDAEGLRAYLASKGVAVPAQIKKARIGTLAFTFKDPEGHSIEVVQYAPESWPVREKGRFMPDTRVSKHIMHVGIIVTKFEAEMKFYEDVLGFREIWRGSSTGTTLSWVNLKLPESEDYIELMLYPEQPDAAHRFSAHHLCLEVPDIEAAVAKLNAEPARKEYTRPIEIKLGKNRKQQANLFDPDGTRTEIMEPRTVDGKVTPPSTAPPPSR